MIPVASDVHKGRCWMAMIPPGRAKNAGADRVHAGGVAGRLASCRRKRRSLWKFPPAGICDERAGGGGMAERRPGCTRRGSTVCAAEVGPAGHPRLVKKLACTMSTHYRGLVSAASDPGLTPAGAAAVRLARLRAQTKNRVHSLLEMHDCDPSGALHQAGTRVDRAASALAALGCASSGSFACTIFFTEERKTSEAELEEAAVAFPQVALLRTIPGLGHVLRRWSGARSET